MATRVPSALPGAHFLPRQARQSSIPILPFLYRTQTLQQDQQPLGSITISRCHQPRRGISTSRAQSGRFRLQRDQTWHQTSRSPRTLPHEENELEDIPLIDPNEVEVDDIPPDSDGSTITPTERATFARLFDDLVKDSSPHAASSAEKQSPKPDSLESGGQVRSILYDALDKSDRKASHQSLLQEDHTSFFPSAKGPEGNEQINEAVSRYPASLRMAAQTAFNAIQQRQQARTGADQATSTSTTSPPTSSSSSTSSEQVAEPTTPVIDPFTQLQQHELRRVEAFLHGAQTDMQLWDVLEKEVFSMVRKIDLAAEEQKLSSSSSPSSSAPAPTPTRRKRKTSKTASSPDPTPSAGPSDSKTATSPATPGPQTPSDSSLPLIPIAALNYPSHLLLALRILRHSFPRSSLAYALLPCIKQLGDISFILGASTALYNELIAILWHKDADYAAIADLLADMQARDVEFDATTLGLLVGMTDKSIRPIAQGKRGDALAQVYRMQAVKKGVRDVKGWKERVRARLYERALRDARGREEDGQSFSV